MAQSSACRRGSMTDLLEPVGMRSARPAIWARLTAMLGGVTGCAGGALVLFVVVCALLAPLIAPYSPHRHQPAAQACSAGRTILVRHRPGRPRRAEPRRLGRPAVAAGRPGRGRHRHDRAAWRSGLFAGFYAGGWFEQAADARAGRDGGHAAAGLGDRHRRHRRRRSRCTSARCHLRATRSR